MTANIGKSGQQPAAPRRRPVRALFWIVLLILAGLCAGLVVCEAAIRLLDLDWRLVQKVLPRIPRLQAHVPSADPRLLYALEPDDPDMSGGKDIFRINSLGCRGLEPNLSDPKRARVLVLGGSNVWGANGITDSQTWPAQLKAILRQKTGAPLEVLNCGVSGYNALQMCATLERLAPRLKPDLIVFAYSNIGPRLFLEGTADPASYFERDPSLWWEILSVDLEQAGEDAVPLDTRLLGLSALYRFARLAHRIAAWEDMPGTFHLNQYRSAHYISTARRCLKAARQKAKVAVFIVPGSPAGFSEYTQGLDIPVLKLDRAGLPQAYLDIHPPAHVLEWTAYKLAYWLLEQGLIKGGNK